MIKRLPLLVCGYLFFQLKPTYVEAQQQFDTSHGNYSGLGGVSWNPASVADNSYSLQFLLAGADAHFTNSAYRYLGAWNYRQPTTDFNVQASAVAPLENKQPRLFSAGVQLRGPGILLRLSNTSGLALSTRVRTAFQGNAISPSLVQNAVEGFQTPSAWRGSAFNVNLNTVTEWDVTYGRIVVNQGRHFWKVGATAKRLMGLGSAYAQGREVSYETIANPYTAGGDPYLAVHQLTGSYGYAHYAELPRFNVQTAQHYLLGQNATGYGWGADIGFIYEYRTSDETVERPLKSNSKKPRDEKSRPLYRFRFGVAVVDIGAVTYNKNTVAYPDISLTENTLQRNDYADIEFHNYETRLPVLYQTVGTKPQDHYIAGMPTTLNVDFDYHITSSLYLNAAFCQSLRSATAIGLRSFSYASLSPRLETRHFELALPLFLVNSYQLPAIGLMLRAGALVVGSNNLAPLFSSAQPYGANIYAEVSLLKLAAKKHD